MSIANGAEMQFDIRWLTDSETAGPALEPGRRELVELARLLLKTGATGLEPATSGV
jgi:hypothetical protein